MPNDPNTWYARVTFIGTPSDDQLQELCCSHGPAISGSTVDDRVTLRFKLENSPTMTLALAALSEKMASPILWKLRESKVLVGPVALELLDDQRRNEQINLEFDLPRDTPPEETGQILLDRLAKLPAATDEDRQRWLGDDPAVRRAQAALDQVNAELGAPGEH